MRLGPVIILLFFFDTIWAQSDIHTVNSYTTKEGLSNNTVYCMAHDSRGFLWLGTKEGLNRFDGFQFKKYFSEKNNPNSLPHDNIFDILEYRFGQLLIATSNGLSVLNTLTGQFENERVGNASIKSGSGTAINSMHRDNQANIWINHDGELDVLDSNLLYLYRFTDLDWAKSLKGILIRFEHWFTDRQGRLWLPSDTSGIHIIDFTAKKIYNSRNNPHQITYLRSHSIRAFLNDEENNILWYAPWGEGLIRYNFLTGTRQQQLFGIKQRGEERTINSIIKTESGTLLCFIGSNWYEINSTTLQFKPLPEKTLLNNPGNGVITSLAILKGGNVQYLVGSNQGLFHLTRGKTPYKELSLVNAGSNFNMEECTDMIISRSGRLYCTYNNNLLVVVEKNRAEIAYYMLTGDPTAVFTEVCEDHLNRIWIGSGKGIYFFDPVKNIFVRPGFLPGELLRSDINLIHCDSDGDIWIATRNPFGLYQYITRNNQVQKVNNHVTRRFETLGESSRISTIAEDKQGHLWMSSRLGGGLIYYEKKNDQWKLYPPSGRNFNSLANKGLVALHAGNDDFLWLSSYFGDGLIRYDYKNDSIRQFTRHDGLMGNYLLNIISDNNKNLWLTTETGITQFDPPTLRARHTISFSGLTANNQQVVIDPLDTMLVVSLNDRLLFIPTSLTSTNTSFPQPFIDKITVNNHVQFIDPQNQQLSLSHDQKNLSIDFTAVQLLNNAQTHFAYRLTGVDKDWIYPDANRSAQYSILAPGNYTFHLKASNESGVWNPEQAVFSFSIATPWWQTNWFRIAIILCIIGFVMLVFRKRVSVIRHEAAMKQKIAETEMMALRAQMNPHFIFNCLNAIDNLVQTNQKEKATTYLARFAKLIRSVLDSSKNNVVPFQNDYESLQLYLQMEQFRCNNKFIYDLKADEELLHSDYKLPPLIVQPFVENAIHHGLLNKQTGDRKLTVSATVENDTIKYTVIDNGVGRIRAQEIKEINKPGHQSYGISITAERIHLYNQNGKSNDVSITDLLENGQPAGTKVEIRLKIYDNNKYPYA